MNEYNPGYYQDADSYRSLEAYRGRHASVQSGYGAQSASQYRGSARYVQAVAKRKRKRRRRRFVAIVLAILLLLVAAVGGYYLFLRHSMSYKGDKDALAAVLAKADYDQPFYVLVIGSDNWEDQGARADAMCLVRVDLNAPQLTMVTVPRDTKFTRADGTVCKLNEMYSSDGAPGVIRAVSEVTGVQIADFVLVEFDGLRDVVDSLGGITVDVPYSFTYLVYTFDQAPVVIQAGVQTLNGEQAIALARMRTAYGEQQIEGFSEDSVRQMNIRNMMVAIMKKVMAVDKLVMPLKVADMAAMVQTDIPLETLISWALKLKSADDIKVFTTTGPYDGTAWSIYGGNWLTYDDPDTWRKLMQAVDSGDDPKTAIETKSTADGKVSNQQTVEINTR